VFLQADCHVLPSGKRRSSVEAKTHYPGTFVCKPPRLCVHVHVCTFVSALPTGCADCRRGQRSRYYGACMKQITGIFSKKDRAAGLAAALALHAIVLTVLWSYRIIPPPSESLTVFVSHINPASPARIERTSAPVIQEPVKQSAAVPVLPTAPPVLTARAPVTSPAEPVAPTPPVKAVPTPTPVLASETAAPVVFQARSPAAPSQPVQLTGELSVACTERTPPVYPKQSLRLGEQGKTVLQVELTEQGLVGIVIIKMSSGFPRLDDAAVTAIKSWRCTPAKRNGVAVRSVAVQPFNFTLKGR